MITSDEQTEIPTEAVVNLDETSTVPSTLSADIVIIGSGMGGGTLAWALRDSGGRVLCRRTRRVLPREPENTQPEQMFVRGGTRREPWYKCGHQRSVQARRLLLGGRQHEF